MSQHHGERVDDAIARIAGFSRAFGFNPDSRQTERGIDRFHTGELAFGVGAGDRHHVIQMQFGVAIAGAKQPNLIITAGQRIAIDKFDCRKSHAEFLFSGATKGTHTIEDDRLLITPG